MNPSDDIQIPVGPQHPAFKEPESFMVHLRGEKITAVNIRLGYNHRGVEKACESRNYIQDIYLLERVCGICSHSHSSCFVQAVEEIAGVEIPPRARYIRTIIGELERIHSHLLWLGVAGHEIGFDTLLMYSWRDREIVMDLLAELTGNRVHYGMNTPGGVRRDISPDGMKSILAAVDKLEASTKYFIGIANEETTVINRLTGVGMLSRDEALALCVAGPTMRASAIDRDVRRDDPYLAYPDLDFKVVVDDHCDVYGRTLVRLGELMEAYRMLRQLVERIPPGDIAVRAPRRIPAGEALSRYEAPRGEDVHYVRANGTDKPDRVKVRAPTLANLNAMTRMLEDRYLADLPIVVAAIDPCFSCTDRMITLKQEGKGDGRVMDWESLRRYSIDWYRARGTDVPRVNKRLGEAR